MIEMRHPYSMKLWQLVEVIGWLCVLWPLALWVFMMTRLPLIMPAFPRNTEIHVAYLMLRFNLSTYTLLGSFLFGCILIFEGQRSSLKKAITQKFFSAYPFRWPMLFGYVVMFLAGAGFAFSFWLQYLSGAPFPYSPKLSLRGMFINFDSLLIFLNFVWFGMAWVVWQIREKSVIE